MSYKGAVAVRGKSGWFYTDPGNFVYTLWWLLTGLAAKHHLKTHNDDVVCKAFRACQGRLVARWPRQKDTPQLCEQIGDMVELVLACSYINDAKYWHLQTTLGPVIIKVREIVRFLDTNARFERMKVSGSFFDGMPSRCACVSRLAQGMFSAMHVQKHDVDLSRAENLRFVTLAPELRLLYPL